MATFTDDFNRGTSNTVGNGWTESEAAPGRLTVDVDELLFTSAAGDEGLLYRTRTGGYGRNNTTIQYKMRFGSTAGSNNICSVSDSGSTRTDLLGTANRRIHMGITTSEIKVYDGTTLVGSANHGLTLATGINYYIRWDIESDYSMRVYINTTGFTYIYADIKLFVTAFTPSSSDGGNWALLGGGNSAQLNEDDLTIYDSVQTAPSGTPTVTTSAVTSITLTTATGNGNVTSDNGYTITERGVCWNTATNPTTANSKATTSGTTGSYSTSMTGLIANTLYYVRAYAINAQGTSYGNEVSFTTLNVGTHELVKDIGAVTGETWATRMVVTGTVGSVTVKLGTTGASTVFAAGSGTQVFQGIYGGASGLIITKTSDFNGTIDNVQWVKVEGTGTIDWNSSFLLTVFPIESEVFFKRIEDEIFNSFRLYRYLDLLFKDLDGYVTVTLRRERNDGVTIGEKEFVVGNSGTSVSPFSKRRISFLYKDQAIVIGLSNASLNETFAIAQFILSGHKSPKKMFGADRIISVG